jgi:hypothetical protein
MAKSTAWVFYVVPRNFNARLIRSKSLHVKHKMTVVKGMIEHPNNEQSDELFILGGNDSTIFSGYVLNEMDLIKEVQINMGKYSLKKKTSGGDPNNYLI